MKRWFAQAPDPVVITMPPRALHPCAIAECVAEQTLIEQDEQWTVVECPEHDIHTRWETTPRVERTQQIIRPQDKWRQHGTRGDPK